MYQFLFNKLLKKAGQMKYQELFRKCYEISLTGMNFGSGGNLLVSGEQDAFKYAQNKFTIKDNFIVFDVGANIGDYSKELSKIFTHIPVKIHAFEPSPKIFGTLINNVGKDNNIICNNLGLGDQDAIVKLYSNSEMSELSSLYARKLDHFNIALDNAEEIKITTLDNYCSDAKISFIDFLKLDVEGHELKVLQGASHMMESRKIQFIQFEFGGCNIDSRTYFQDFYYMLNSNYTLYRIVKDGLVKIETYSEKDEIFTTINYLAELKGK